MRMSVEVDSGLVEKAMRLTKISAKGALVHRALEELVRITAQKGMLQYENSGVWEGNLNEMRLTKHSRLDDLVSRITAENLHAEVETGEPVGAEIW